MAKSETYREIMEITNVLQSKAFRQVLSDRKHYLQDLANSFVRQQEWTEAFAAIAKMDDLNKTVDIMNKRLEDLKKEE